MSETEISAGDALQSDEWLTVDQNMINAFADVTRDRQYIHVDPERAKATPFGSTIAHGMLTLSLMPQMVIALLEGRMGGGMIINYGFDKVRFIAPVKVDSRVRLNATVRDINERDAGQRLLTLEVEMSIDGGDKPALVAEWLILSVAS